MPKGTDLVFETLRIIAILSIVVIVLHSLGIAYGFLNEIYYGSYFILFFSIFLLGLSNGNALGGLFWGAIISGCLFFVLVIIIPAVS
jgi:hypothetical protein